jgi:hypothetical protein
MDKLDIGTTILVIAIPVIIIVIAAANFTLFEGGSLELE